jgi:ketosteroid isomerase-like protein
MQTLSLNERVERVESHLAIQQIVARYALALDGRDLDALVALFVDDVNCGKWGVGRPALRGFYDKILRNFYRSQHQICGQVIDLIDSDHATGKVYCRAEHEDRGKWVVMAICYFDSYERRDGAWSFVRRVEQDWYATDILERPAGPEFRNWPGRNDGKRSRLPHAFPTWQGFWAQSDPAWVSELSDSP